MTTPHPYRLRAYHNPQRADESLVPDGWTMLYADEFPLSRKVPCRLFVKPIYCGSMTPHFGFSWNASGRVLDITYIVPVAP
jgi:hypothetical protein